MDSFHSFADWKAQSVQDVIEKLQKRKADYDRVRAEREEMKTKLNTCAIERAQRQEHKKEVGSPKHLLPSKFKLEWARSMCFYLCTVNPEFKPLYFFLQLHFLPCY
jgi:hypothetical protein